MDKTISKRIAFDFVAFVNKIRKIFCVLFVFFVQFRVFRGYCCPLFLNTEQTEIRNKRKLIIDLSVCSVFP
jgi:hypothetical protein